MVRIYLDVYFAVNNERIRYICFAASTSNRYYFMSIGKVNKISIA